MAESIDIMTKIDSLIGYEPPVQTIGQTAVEGAQAEQPIDIMKDKLAVFKGRIIPALLP